MSRKCLPAAGGPVVTAVRPADAAAPCSTRMTENFSTLAEALLRLLDADAPGADPLWSARLGALGQRVAELADRDGDACLFAVVVAAVAGGVAGYSSRHALASAGVAARCAAAAGLPAAERHALTCAALTMNVAMTALQDELVHRERTPTLAQRLAIDQHPARGAELLRDAGVADPLWLEIVARHHDAPPAAGEEDDGAPDAPPGRRLARLLQKIDVFLAKASPRATRKGLPVALALRETCLDANGRSDAAGRTMVHALGLYPPASVVRLTNAETAVVVGRGTRLDRPRVASVSGADRRPLPVPQPRDPRQPEHAVESVLRARDLPAAPGERRLEAVLRGVQAACFSR